MSFRRAAPAVLALSLVLSACGGGDGDQSDNGKKDEPSPSATVSSSPEVDDNAMTAWGADLSYGEPARFLFSPKANKEATVEVSVDSVERAKISAFSGFKLDESLRKSTPYYVRVSVTNIGTTQAGGAELPLFLDNGTDVLFPPANITASFKPCPNRLLPDKFAPDATAELCMVFLAGEGTTLRAVALQTPEGADQIEWTGELTKPEKKKNNKGKKGKGKKTADQPTDGATPED